MICKICDKEKIVSEFYTKDKVCKTCRKERAKIYRKENSAKLKLYFKQLKKDNPEKFQIRDKHYYLNNKEAIKNKTSKYSKINSEKIKSYMKNYKLVPSTRYKGLLRQAKRRNKFVELSLEDYTQIISKPCFYCNNKLSKPVKNSTGLDRLDNSLGYVKDNVVSCCASCNTIRNNILSVYEMQQVIKLILVIRSQTPELSSILEQISSLHDQA